ncbi:hypothetical protein [Gimesia maris]|uniref:hypothetical protein n=1 Tax=Gimesia maris TaxID=122 RepID=UPI0032EE3A1C
MKKRMTEDNLNEFINSESQRTDLNKLLASIIQHHAHSKKTMMEHYGYDNESEFDSAFEELIGQSLAETNRQFLRATINALEFN